MTRPHFAQPSVQFQNLAAQSNPAGARFVRVPRKNAPIHLIASNSEVTCCGWQCSRCVAAVVFRDPLDDTP
eukprot:15439170-Alexandrium_andersonii.AAC.1